ncbi:RECEPTOR-LIKE PROTEIN 12 [Salix koriyanagi]|uniref:RECEPTOR-LIKE PROTEIN 12 n=1 Tax=Salix koriyanagi TaxID=2511006 RepID=A0A9Q1ANN1_9ROSI|nr:RECEPTOR-LIKE PROTEIN 12 [Salix koriyanagi]
MMGGENRNLEHIEYDPLKLTNGLYYQDSITVTFKDLELELVKILTVFTSADFSNNNFEVYNRLVGRIPTGSQMQTFPSDSFEGNPGLCGPPLNLVCSNTSGSTFKRRSNQRKEFDWNFFSAELGSIFGLGIIILPLMFCKRWRTWYYTHVDRVIFRVFPQLDKRSNNLGRRAQRNRRRQ